jgi:hypothetical protein
MTPENWSRIKAIKVPEPRYVHISKECGMREVTDPKTGVKSMVPWWGPGQTYRKE